MRHAYLLLPWYALKRGVAEIIQSLLRQITRNGCELSAAFDYLCVMSVINAMRTYLTNKTYIIQEPNDTERNFQEHDRSIDIDIVDGNHCGNGGLCG